MRSKSVGVCETLSSEPSTQCRLGGSWLLLLNCFISQTWHQRQWLNRQCLFLWNFGHCPSHPVFYTCPHRISCVRQWREAVSAATNNFGLWWLTGRLYAELHCCYFRNFAMAAGHLGTFHNLLTNYSSFSTSISPAISIFNSCLCHFNDLEAEVQKYKVTFSEP